MHILHTGKKRDLHLEKRALKYLNPLLEGDAGRAILFSMRMRQRKLLKGSSYNDLLAIRRISIQAFV